MADLTCDILSPFQQYFSIIRAMGASLSKVLCNKVPFMFRKSPASDMWGSNSRPHNLKSEALTTWSRERLDTAGNHTENHTEKKKKSN